MLLILPGFIAQSIYDLFVPSKDRDAATNFFLGLAYGTLNLALTWPLLSWASSAISKATSVSCGAVVAYVDILFSLAVFPAFLGYLTFRLRESSWFQGWTITPSPTAWDNFFAQRKSCWIIFHLKGGQRIGGHYCAGSHASAFPNEPDVYVSEVWRINEFFQFEEMVEGSMGALIRRDDCELIEFLREDS